MSLTDIERRSRLRFPVVREIRYKSLWKCSDLQGRGETINISSSGALFTTEQELSEGLKVEVTIPWPIQFNEMASLKLVAQGIIVRAEPATAAVRFERHEFRIAALWSGSLSRQPVLLNRAPPARQRRNSKAERD